MLCRGTTPRTGRASVGDGGGWGGGSPFHLTPGRIGDASNFFHRFAPFSAPAVRGAQTAFGAARSGASGPLGLRLPRVEKALGEVLPLL